MLKINDTLLLIIDIQEKLFRVMPNAELLRLRTEKLIKGCNLLGIPAVITEQNPSGLGSTIPDLNDLLPQASKFTKFSFSCCAESNFREYIISSGRRQVIVCGIESHICVYQTSLDLICDGLEVYLVTDCIASRNNNDKDLALRRLEMEGVKLTSLEMALFELLRTAKAEQFKAVSALIK